MAFFCVFCCVAASSYTQELLCCLFIYAEALGKYCALIINLHIAPF